MPTHGRTQLRAALRTALLGLSQTAGRVEIGRVRPLAKDFAPTLLISTPQEDVGRDAGGLPPILARIVMVHIDIAVQSASVPDDQLDAIACDVEAAVEAADLTMLRDIELIGMEQIVNADNEKHIGGQRLKYRATYRTRQGAPQNVIIV